jgi:ABC-type transport system involved in cytochrome c biogenesis ATPase subunit
MTITINDRDGQLSANPFTVDFGNFVVLTGNNNSGKTTLMRYMAYQNTNAYLVNSNRVNVLGEGAQDRSYLQNFKNYGDAIKNADSDNAPKNIQVLQDLFNLPNSARREIIDYYNDNFPNRAQVRLEDPKNSASARLLTMKGHSITKQGSGARSMLEILVKLFDSSINLLCIDEPEIALEPKLQKVLFKAIKAKATRDKRIVVATHSHHFLDRTEVGNNFICSRDQRNKIHVTRISSEIQLRNLVFDLLGNDLGDLGLPNKLIIVEGPSDASYIRRICSILGRAEFTTFGAGSDSLIKSAAEGVSEYLRFVSDLAPVYRDRIWVIADKQTDNQKVREWRGILNDMSGSEGRVLVLRKNGIEYYYPERIMQEIFNTKTDRDSIANGYLRANPNSFNDIQISKTELSRAVSEKLLRNDLHDGDEITDFVANLS